MSNLKALLTMSRENKIDLRNEKDQETLHARDKHTHIQTLGMCKYRKLTRRKGKKRHSQQERKSDAWRLKVTI